MRVASAVFASLVLGCGSPAILGDAGSSDTGSDGAASRDVGSDAPDTFFSLADGGPDASSGAHVGDGCAHDSDCQPGAIVDEGFGGGPAPLALVCGAAGTCVRSVELCDATDDDLDGRIDEGCACSPRAIAASRDEPIGSSATFGGARILVTFWSDLGSAAELLDADGMLVGSPLGVRALNGSISSVVRFPGEFVVYAHSSAFPDAFTHVADDGTTRTQRLAGDTNSLGIAARWGTGLALFTSSDRTRWTVSRIDGTPWGSTGAGALTTRAGADLIARELPSGELLVVEAASAMPLRASVLDATLAVRETAAPSDARQGYPSEVAESADRLWIPATDASGAWLLASIDRATGAWAESIPLGPIVRGHGLATALLSPVHVAVQDPYVLASWMGADQSLRTLVYDASGHEVARTTLPLGFDALGLWLGTTDLGARAVIDHVTELRVIAPCVLP